MSIIVFINAARVDGMSCSPAPTAAASLLNQEEVFFGRKSPKF